MSDDNVTDTNRRSLLKLAGLAGIPLLAGNASAATGDHLGETWTGSEGLTLDLTGFNSALEASTEEGFGLRGIVTSETASTSIGVVGYSDSTNGTGVRGTAAAGSGDTIGVRGETNSSNGYGVYGTTNNQGGYGVYSDGDLHVQGNFTASGTKNFVQTVETPDGPQEIAYTAIEADRAQTETTGVAELEDGRAEIDLPEHFGLVTSADEDLVVQLTPYAVDAAGLAVTERSVERIVVETTDGDGDLEFSYTVRGVREGYEDKEIVRDAE